MPSYRVALRSTLSLSLGVSFHEEQKLLRPEGSQSQYFALLTINNLKSFQVVFKYKCGSLQASSVDLNDDYQLIESFEEKVFLELFLIIVRLSKLRVNCCAY